MALDTTERISCSAPWQQHLDLDISYLSTAILNLGTLFFAGKRESNFDIDYLHKGMLNSL
jgi:hypothetical protein